MMLQQAKAHVTISKAEANCHHVFQFTSDSSEKEHIQYESQGFIFLSHIVYF